MKSKSKQKPKTNILEKLSFEFTQLIVLSLLYASFVSLIPEIWRFALAIFWFIIYLILAYGEKE